MSNTRRKRHTDDRRSHKGKHHEDYRSTSNSCDRSSLSTCDLIQINYTRTGERGFRGFDRLPEDHRNGGDRWNCPSTSSGCPYSRNSGHESVNYDSGHGKRLRDRVKEDDQIPMSKKQMKRLRHQRMAESVTALPPGFNQIKSLSMVNLNPRELASELVKRLIQMGGTASMDQLKSSIYSDDLIQEVEELSSDGTLEGFLKQYHDIFAVTRLDGGLWENDESEFADKNVTYIFNLELCKINGIKPGTCTEKCKNLHMCKFHVMSSCQTLGCRYGHGVEVGHNDDVLRHHYLDRLTPEEVTEQLLRLENRRGLTVPELCTFYCSPKGCMKDDTCSYMHVCKFYILDNCDFSSRCKRRHGLSDHHTRSILKMYGLKDIPDQKIKLFLKQAYNDPIVSTSRFTKSPLNDDVQCPQWLLHDGVKNAHHLVVKESRQLEELYKQYLGVVQRTITIKGQPFQVNFAEMTARVKGGQSPLQLMRLPD